MERYEAIRVLREERDKLRKRADNIDDVIEYLQDEDDDEQAGEFLEHSGWKPKI